MGQRCFIAVSILANISSTSGLKVLSVTKTTLELNGLPYVKYRSAPGGDDIQTTMGTPQCDARCMGALDPPTIRFEAHIVEIVDAKSVACLFSAALAA